MASIFLKDWKKGDVVTAADLQELTDAVAMLENTARKAWTGSSAGGAVQRENEPPVEWPWQVLATTGVDGVELYVVPGRVAIGGSQVFTNAAGERMGGFDYVTMPGNVVKVPGFDATQQEPQVVYLQLRGEVKARQLQQLEVYPEQDSGAAAATALTAHQRTELVNAALELLCVPLSTSLLPQDDLLRVWPLAIYTPGHEQPVNQLQWGELSACECRGLVDSWGDVVWPTDRSGAAAWGAAGHEAGMATLTEADFSTEYETIMGPLWGCMDLDGAVEFYLGDHPAPPYVGPLPWVDPDDPNLDDGDEDEEEEEDTDDSDDDGGGDGGDGGDDDDEEVPDDQKIAVKIGYEAGDGFKSCTLVRKAGGYYWKLELDPDAVRICLTGLQVPATMTLAANGSQQGNIAVVTMSLGDSSASASGSGATGSGALLFKGTQGSQGVASRTHTFKYSIDVSLNVAGKTWYLSPRAASDAGSWVKKTRSDGTSNFNVRASEWWTWSIDSEKLKAAGINHLKQELAKRTLSASDTSTSSDSTVTGTLTGTPLAIHATATLGGAE